MNRFLLLLLPVLLWTTCKKKEGEDCPKSTYEYTFKNKSRVDTTRPYGAATSYLAASIVPGPKRVFRYAWTQSNCTNIA
ncbi:MAG: hypothetical protein JST39_18440, partial [Bacteroidetes bacterium]|nr:hypothetical protein [Bacteroidota bacterium]